jgi:hypothetical protein
LTSRLLPVFFRSTTTTPLLILYSAHPVLSGQKSMPKKQLTSQNRKSVRKHLIPRCDSGSPRRSSGVSGFAAYLPRIFAGIVLLVFSISDFPGTMLKTAPGQSSGAAKSTVLVAAADASPASRAAADFTADGEGDQEQINAAILSLPAADGTVQLSEGTFDIRNVPDTLGGVLISRSNVILTGRGHATRLRLAAEQNTNVIRIIGSDVGHIVIRDLCVDANRDQNRNGQGDPGISHDRFEFCGIKAFRQSPRGPSAAVDTHDITITGCTVQNSHRLGIMLEGPNMRVVDNVLGNAGSDSVEILTGPGMIRGNIVEITGQTHVAIGSDRADNILMTDNIVRVLKGGKLDIAFRSWAGSERHVISDNIVRVEPGGVCTLAIDIRGTDTTVTGNTISTPDPAVPTRIRFAAGNAVFSSNVLENTVVEIDDQTASPGPIIIGDNILTGSKISFRKGNLKNMMPAETTPE